MEKHLTTIRLTICGLLLLTPNSFAQPIKVVPDDGNSEDFFGYSVAIDKEIALVGAYKADSRDSEDAGAAYIFAKTKEGWQQQAKLIASPRYPHDTLGGNVALKHGFALLGARNSDVKKKNAGAVFVFKKENDTWSQTQVLTAVDAREDDAYGQSIALTEKFLVIGAPHSDSSYTDSGAAYVYKKANNQWQFQTKLTATDGAEGDLFGISVAIDGNTILVGADLHDAKAENAGAAYTFVFDDNQWHQQAKLLASDGEKTDIFGVRVALNGNTALISARRDDIEGVGIDAGSAYIFERSNGAWKQTDKITAPDGHADDRFGRGVALTSSTAIISAMHSDVSAVNQGALYIYEKQNGKWRFKFKTVASDASENDRFGWNVALYDHMAIVGTPHKDDNGAESGAAYILDVKKAP